MGYFVPAAEHLRNDTGLPISPAGLSTVTAIQVRELRKSYGGPRPSTACRSTSRRARSTRCSVTTGPASRRSSRSWKATALARPARSACSVSTRPVAGRDVPGPDRHRAPVVGRRDRAHRPRGGRAVRLGVPPAAPGRRGDRPGRPRRQGVGQRIDTLSGGQKRRLDLALGIVGRPERAVPRRADDRLRCRRAPQVVGADRRTLPARHDGAADDPLPRRGGAPRRPRRRAARGTLVAEGTPGGAHRPAGRHRRVVHASSAPTSPRSAGVLPTGPSSQRSARRVHDDRPDRDVHAVTGWAMERGVAARRARRCRARRSRTCSSASPTADADARRRRRRRERRRRVARRRRGSCCARSTPSCACSGARRSRCSSRSCCR